MHVCERVKGLLDVLTNVVPLQQALFKVLCAAGSTVTVYSMLYCILLRYATELWNVGCQGESSLRARYDGERRLAVRTSLHGPGFAGKSSISSRM
jgi:hypothetical protein